MNVLKLHTLRRSAEISGTEKLRFGLVLLYLLSLPFDLFYSSVIFYTLCVTTLLDLNLQKLKSIPKQIWIFQLIYFIGVLGYFNSYHKDAAMFLLERQLMILVFPIILPLAISFRKDMLEPVLRTMTLASLLALLYLFSTMIYSIVYDLKLPLIKTAFSGAFFNHPFSKPIGMHAGYLSLYVSFSVFYCVQEFQHVKGMFRKSMLVLILLFLFSGLVFLASRNAIIATFFILVFVFPYFGVKNKILYILISIGSVVLVYFIMKNVPYLKERFSIELITDIKPLKDGTFLNFNTAEPRIERWKVALELIRQSPVVGYGTGDEIEMLKSGYLKKNLFISYIENFNSHNQYLSYLLKHGILGFLLFVGAFVYYLRLGFKHRSFMYVAFLMLLLIGFYTENILDSNKGIVFFAFFNTFFGYLYLNKAKTEEN